MLNAAAGMSPREVRIRYDTGSRHFLVHQANDFGEDNPSRHGPRIKRGQDICWTLDSEDRTGVIGITLWFPKSGMLIHDQEGRAVPMPEKTEITPDQEFRVKVHVSTPVDDAIAGDVYPYAVYLKLEPNYGRPLDQPGDQLAQSFSHPVVILSP